MAPAKRIIDSESFAGAAPVEVRDSSEGLAVTALRLRTAGALKYCLLVLKAYGRRGVFVNDSEDMPARAKNPGEPVLH